MGTISVLMSVYKSEKPEYLDRSMQSIWDDQLVKPEEIVLVEDGKLTDGLYEVISKWKHTLDKKLKIIENEQNLGLTKSLNKGIRAVTGNYVARMDSDDISRPERFKIQRDFLNEHPDVVVVGSAICEFDDDNPSLGVRKYPADTKGALSTIHKANPIAHPTVMIRKDKVFDAGILYNEHFRKSQDLVLWFDVLAAGLEVANIQEPLLNFRRDKNFTARRNKTYAKNEFHAYAHGIKKLYGTVNYRYIFPLMRLFFRLLPTKLISKVYGSNIRKKVTG